MMRIGFISGGVEEDFSFAKEHGIPCVELNLSEDMSLCQRGDEINAWREKYGVDISHVGLYGRNYISDDLEERQRHFKDLRILTDFVASVGAKIVTTGGGHPEGRTDRQNCQRFFEFFPPAIEYAEGRGLKLTLYNCHWGNFVIGPSAWEIILGKYPNLGIKFDPSHPVYDGRDWLKEMADFGQSIVHTHAKDTLFVAGKPFEDVPAGLGSTNWGLFMGMLYHHHYKGDINIEPHSATWHGEMMYQGILIARRHLQQFMV